MKRSLIHSVIIFLTLLALTFSAIGVTPVYAATFTVTTSSNNGTGSLRQILTDAPSGSTVTFDTSLSGTTIYLASPLNIVKKVTIDGSMLASKITISGDSDGDGAGNVAVFANSAGTLGDSVKLDNLIIAHGFALNPLSFGGGIYNTGFLTLQNSILEGNDAELGGGIYNDGTLTVTNSELSVNFANQTGGGIYNIGILFLTNSTLSGNAAFNHGGGIYNNGVLSITNSTLSGNGATNSGGGIYNVDTLTVTNSTLSDNDAVEGGGIYNWGSTLTVKNSTISNNSATDGGGIYDDVGVALIVINSTLAHNRAYNYGGGIYNGYLGIANVYNITIASNEADADGASNGIGAGIYNEANATFNMRNSVVAGNYLPGGVYNDCTGVLGIYGSNRFLNTVGCTAAPGSQGSAIFIGSIAELGVLQNNGGPTETIALLPPSNMIDGGVACSDENGNTLLTDQRGLPRVAGENCDIGAYEFSDYTPPIVSSIVRAKVNATSPTTVYFAVNFSEVVTGVTAGDFSLWTSGVSGSFISSISGSGSVYIVSVNTGSGSGTIRLDVVDDNSIIDEAFNSLGGAAVGDGSFTTGEVYTINKGGDTTGVFRPGNGLLYLKNANTSGFADVAINYGLGGDYPVAGDWDGNGTATIGIYRNGSFYLRNSNTVGFADIVVPFGTPGDQPLVGDWNGDGVDTIGVYSNGQFLLRNSNSAGTADMSFYLGNPGDVGIAGDWNGDGLDTTGVFRPSNGVIFLKNLNTTGFADININYGLAGDMPVIGDWNNDGIDTIGVYRNAQFLLRNSNTIGFADIVFALGNPGDMPISGNWDGIP